MAKIRFSLALLEQVIFGSTPHIVEIERVAFDPMRDEIEFEISGQDVPVAEELRGIFTVEQNRRGERLTRLHFEPAAGTIVRTAVDEKSGGAVFELAR